MPLPGAYHRGLLPVLERKLAAGDYSLCNLEAAVVEIPSAELVNVNSEADLVRVSTAPR